MTRFHRQFAAAFASVLALSLGSMLHGSTIGTSVGVEFGIGGSSGIGAGLSPSQVAGVIPSANWNVASGNSGTINNLTGDFHGAPVATSVSVNWTTSDTWNNGGTSGFSGADNTLNNGYLDGGSGQNTDVNLLGLNPGLKYDLYITSTGGTTENKSGTIGVNGTYDSSVVGQNDTSGSYVLTTGSTAGNYHEFLGVTPVFNVTNHDWEINISTDASNSGRTPINSIQFTAMPEPSSFLLCGLGAAALLLAARRRRR